MLGSQANSRTLEPTAAANSHGISVGLELGAVAALIWYAIVWLVCGIGYFQLNRYYTKTPLAAFCLTSLSASEVPHVTIIRPVKDLEPRLYECLAATFRQTYPRDKLTIFFCVSSRHDAGYPTLIRLLEDFPGFDVKIVIEDEDRRLQGDNDGTSDDARLGPNPKIRNMSRAYREAKGDIVWIIDCNVWIGKGVAGRMVDTLMGYGAKKRAKFVHQLPLVIDLPLESESLETQQHLAHQDPLSYQSDASKPATDTTALLPTNSQIPSKGFWAKGGGRLEEMFMSSSHAKFYIAINTVLIAPCIVGKSNMFRRSHLNALTTANPLRSPGIDFFSDNICEDHLIGDLLWKQNVPGEGKNEKWEKHALVFGDIAFQPMSSTSVGAYIARRVRWLRVRKFTVTLATLVEHGTESIACSLYGAFAVTTLPFFKQRFGISQTWPAFWAFFAINILLWCFVDWTLYLKLHAGKSIEIDEHVPNFALPPHLQVGQRKRYVGGSRRPFHQWLFAWIGREVLAFPIWAWAVFGGVTVEWRGKKFWVGLDMKVHEIRAKENDERRNRRLS